MKHVFSLVCLLFCGALLSGIVALHDAPLSYTEGENVVLSLDIQDGLDTIQNITLCYKSSDDADFRRSGLEPQTPGSNLYAVELTGRELDGKDFSYYFEYALKDGQLIKYPNEEQGGQLYELRDQAQTGKLAEEFILLTDDPDFPQQDSYILAVSYLGLAGRIDPASVKLWINGKDVTSKAKITENALVYRNDRPKAGTYKAVVTALTNKGENLKSPTFETKVTTTKQGSAIDLGGQVYFLSNFYKHNQPGVYDPYGYEFPRDGYATGLDMAVKYGRSQISANLLLSSRENKNRQPVDRYHIGLEIPSISFHAGDYAPSISPLVMSGKNIRGLYGKLNGQYMGLELACGEMVRKTLKNASGTNITAFRQEAIGGRFRLGLENGLSLGVNFARNRDLISSLDPEDFIHYDPVTADTLFSVAPQDNLVLSVDARINIPWLRTTLGAEFAGSLLNRNTWYGPISAADLGNYIEDYGVLDFEPAELAEMFVIGRPMEPLSPSKNACAAQAYLRANILNNLINVNAGFTGPAFNALSTSSQLRDTQTFSVTDMFNLGRSFFISGGYSQVRDNYSKTALQTDTYSTWHLQSSLRLLKILNLKAAYFSSNAKNEANPELAGADDYLPYQRNSRALTLGIGYNAANIDYIPYQADISYRVGKDSNDLETSYGNYDNSLSSITFSLASKMKKIPLRVQMALSIAGHEARLETIDPENSYNLNLQIKGTYTLFAGKFVPRLVYRTQRLSGDQGKQAYNYWIMGLEANPWRNVSLSTDLGTRNYTNAENTSLNTNSLTWSLSLTQKF